MGGVGRRHSPRATAAQGPPRVPRPGLRASRPGSGREPGPHDQQGPRAPPRHPLRAWEQELIDAPPRFPAVRDQRDVAGRHYLTRPEINALYFATHKMGRPRGWDAPHSIGRYWRAALVVFFNYGVDTGTAW